LDGGITLCSLDPFTGRVLERRVVYSGDSETDDMPSGDAFNIPGMLTDVLVGDGSAVWMRRQKVAGGDERRSRPVYATGGFRDDSWFNRTTWAVGDVQHAQLLVFDERYAYGIEAYASTGRAAAFRPGDKGYRLFAKPLKGEAAAANVDRRGGSKSKKRKRDSGRDLWSIRIPVRGTAMALAGDTLFVAGAPDVTDDDDPLGPLEGRSGGRLLAFHAETGKQISELGLDDLPVWDGMAVANGRVYLATQTGSIVCLGSK
jgi:hypothetical protein